MKRFTYLLILVILSFSIPAKAIKNDIKEGVLRLHIVAEDNSIKAQELKLKVRDSVLLAFSEIALSAKDKKEAEKLFLENKNLIENAVEKVLLSEGENIPFEVSLSKCEFPIKTYKNISLPAGEYDAVNIYLGKAKGENWWCVMYPPLCFSDVVIGKVSKDGEKVLERTLSDASFNLITEENKEKIVIKFKILELFS